MVVDVSLIQIVVGLLIFLVTSFSFLHKRSSTKKKEKRPRIIDQVQKVISPFIDQITREIETLEKGSFNWSHTSYFHGSGSVLKLEPFYHNTKAITLRDVYSENKGLKKKIEKHNNLIPELEGKLKKLEEKILTPDFIKLCEEKAKVFNQKKHDYDYKLQERELKNIHLGAVTGIINNERIFHSEDGSVMGVDRVFWNDFREEFLKFREERGIKGEIETASELGDAIRKIAEEIKDELEKIREKYRKKYNLTQDELISKELRADSSWI